MTTSDEIKRIVQEALAEHDERNLTPEQRQAKEQERADEAALRNLGSLFDMELDQPSPEEAFK